MNLIERRRGMGVEEGEHYNWVPMLTLDYKSWYRNTGVTLSGDWIVFRTTGLNWNCNLTGEDCKYTYGDLPSKIFRISCDYEISGMSSGNQMALNVGTYGYKKPQSYPRLTYTTNSPKIAENGTGHFEAIFEALNWSGTPKVGQFVDIRIYFYAPTTATGKLKNITIDVHVPN